MNYNQNEGQYGGGQSQGYYTPPPPQNAQYQQQPPQQGIFKGYTTDLLDRFNFFFFLIKVTISRNNQCTHNHHLNNRKIVVAEGVWHGKLLLKINLTSPFKHARSPHSLSGLLCCCAAEECCSLLC